MPEARDANADVIDLAARALRTPWSGILGARCPACFATPDVALESHPGHERPSCSETDRSEDRACAFCGWSTDLATQSGAQDPTQACLAAGTALRDEFIVGRTLGKGGFGITYLAWDARLRRRRAIKEFFPSGVALRGADGIAVEAAPERDELFRTGISEYLSEAQVLARFERHPCIVSPVSFFECNGTAYLVMEYLQGETLSSYVLRNGGRIAFEHARHFLYPILDALTAVHSNDMIHRDVTPDNIFLTVDGATKLIDFGAARQSLARADDGSRIVLRDRYAPPEQYRSSSPPGAWTDVYAFCATFYFAITGRPPPPALEREVNDELEEPSRLGVSIPAAAQSALLRGLSLHGWERPDLSELGLALLDHTPPAAADRPGRGPVGWTARSAADSGTWRNPGPWPNSRDEAREPSRDDPRRRPALEAIRIDPAPLAAMTVSSAHSPSLGRRIAACGAGVFVSVSVLGWVWLDAREESIADWANFLQLWIAREMGADLLRAPDSDPRTP